MSNRSAKFVSAFFASFLVGANFAAVAEDGTKPADTTKAADNCLSGPKGTVPAGSHWYYRLERSTKRQCWYIGEEKIKNKMARAAAPHDVASSTKATSPVPQQQNPAVSKSVADAHAEWTSPKSSVAPDTNVTGPIAAGDNSQRTIAPDSGQPSLISSRWPGVSESSASNNPQLADADPAASPQANAEPAPDEPQPAVSPVALTAANAAVEKPRGSTQMLLIVMASALAFAGLVASIIFRFGRKPARVDVRDDRAPAPWDSMHITRPPPPRFVSEQAPVRRAEVAQDPPPPGDAEKRIAEMLSRLARSAST